MRFIRFNASWTALKNVNRGAGFKNVFGAAPRVFIYSIIVVSSNGNNNNSVIFITILIMLKINVLI